VGGIARADGALIWLTEVECAGAFGVSGQLLMFEKLRNAILVDLLSELLPPALDDDEGSQAADDLRPLGGPAHSRAAQPLFDQCCARRLGHTRSDRHRVLKIAHGLKIMLERAEGPFVTRRYRLSAAVQLSLQEPPAPPMHPAPAPAFQAGAAPLYRPGTAEGPWRTCG
jgi:hypothetical protein